MKIKDAIRYNEMQEFMFAPMKFFEQFGRRVECPENMMYIHRNTSSHILGVALLDSVNDYDHFHVNQFDNDTIIFNTHLDDRLGAYVLLVVLPRMGINTDILLTEGEEIHKSTAAHFKPDKKYNWRYSFDRRGTDAVHYRYSDKPWLDTLRPIFGPVSHGSLSDIDYLGHLGCCGVNIGTGYHGEHDMMAFVSMNELISQIGKFVHLFQGYKRTRFEYVEKKWENNYYQPWKSPTPALPPVVPPAPEREEEEEPDEYFPNPYEKMVLENDIPLDILEYVDERGILIHPTECAFCLEPLAETGVNVFMGICKECEPFAIQCVECEEHFCRDDSPEPHETSADLYGICSVCLNFIDNRSIKGNETTGFQNTSDYDRDIYRGMGCYY